MLRFTVKNSFYQISPVWLVLLLGSNVNDNDEQKNLFQKFLASLTPAVILSASERSQLHRWHAKFELSSVPEVDVADLPQVII